MSIMWRLLWLLSLVMLQLQQVQGACSRIPLGASGDRSAVDENFKILIDGNPTTYIPEHQYNVSLSCPLSLKFLSFTLVVESEEPTAYGNGLDMTGHFELFSNGDTKFSAGCENMVENTNTNAKTRIDVSWVAPRHPESGCVLIKAGVVQHRDVWFIDDGFLTKRICPEEIDDINSLTPPLENCCACDEAKYEILLERKWARNTHAKDFPAEAWRTRLGEIIGASHSFNYRYWAYGGRASLGMQELAEHGATRTLEQEIRSNTLNGYVRTIIKAPGIAHRFNALSTTLANARLDPVHHQISLSAKIDPSPDWILGVAGLELCLSNCTWVESKVLNLYPWDVGTDSGPSYMSADQPQVPPDVIRRISSSYPSDHRSPFFDETGAPMKPLATLYLTRKKLYIRECEAVPQEGPLECATHPWNDWTNCSTRCGSGYMQRARSYKNPALAASFNCDRRLLEMQDCQGTQCGLGDELIDGNEDGGGVSAECELTFWSAWSACSKPCGRGLSTRTRDFRNARARAHCLAGFTLPLEESRDCTGTDCGGTIPGSYIAREENEEQDDLAEHQVFGETNEPEKPAWMAGSSRSYNAAGFQGPDNSGQQQQAGYESYNRNTGSTISSGNNYNVADSFNTQQYNRRPAELERSKSYANNEQLVGQRPINYKDYELPGRQTFRNGNEPLSDPNPINYQDSELPGRKPSRYGNVPRINQRQNSPPSYDRVGTFDSDERKGLTVGGVDASNYNVVQDYCNIKPFASTRPCVAKPIIESNFWFYDHEDHECKIFTTDNCDENKNRFRTLRACEGTCLLPQENLYQAEAATTQFPYGRRAYRGRYRN